MARRGNAAGRDTAVRYFWHSFLVSEIASETHCLIQIVFEAGNECCIVFRRAGFHSKALNNE